MRAHSIWRTPDKDLPARQYVCGYCGLSVASTEGYARVRFDFPTERDGPEIYACPQCRRPTYFEGDMQTPAPAFGAEVPNLPADVAGLYREARNCMQVSAFTAATLAARKLLMNVAVSVGAVEGESFVRYVEFLQTAGYVPPKARGWVDHIRKKGNEATHEIPGITRPDAEELLTFAEMILKLAFDYPARVPPPSP